MTTAVFDTLKASRKLKAAGIDEAHAEAIVQSMAEAFDDAVATKADLKIEIGAVRADIEKLEASVKSDIKLLKWMIGVVLACVAFPILKSFLL